MKNREEIHKMIDEVENELQETEDAIWHMKSVLGDVYRVVIPMQKAQLEILRTLAESM